MITLIAIIAGAAVISTNAAPVAVLASLYIAGSAASSSGNKEKEKGV